MVFSSEDAINFHVENNESILIQNHKDLEVSIGGDKSFTSVKISNPENGELVFNSHNHVKKRNHISLDKNGASPYFTKIEFRQVKNVEIEINEQKSDFFPYHLNWLIFEDCGNLSFNDGLSEEIGSLVVIENFEKLIIRKTLDQKGARKIPKKSRYGENNSEIYLFDLEYLNVDKIKCECFVSQYRNVPEVKGQIEARYVWVQDLVNMGKLPDSHFFRQNVINATEFCYIKDCYPDEFQYFNLKSNFKHKQNLKKYCRLTDENKMKLDSLSNLYGRQINKSEWDPENSLRQVEKAYISDMNFREGGEVFAARQEYLKKKSSNPVRWLVFAFNEKTSRYQTSFVMPLVWVLFLIFSYTVLYFFIEGVYLRIDLYRDFESRFLLKPLEIYFREVLRPWKASEKMIVISYFFFFLQASLLFMFKHAFNRFTNYKW